MFYPNLILAGRASGALQVYHMTRGMYYKSFTIVIYDRNDSAVVIDDRNDNGQHYKTIMILAKARIVNYYASVINK